MCIRDSPPWERVKLQEQEFFAQREPAIAGATNAAARKRLIHSLKTTNPALEAEWRAATREAEATSQLLRRSGRYPPVSYTHLPEVTPAQRQRWLSYYSSIPLRRRARVLRRTSHGDEWHRVWAVIHRLGLDGIPELGVPPLRGLFAPTHKEILTHCLLYTSRCV